MKLNFTTHTDEHLPILCDLRKPDDQEKVETLIKNHPNLKILDEIRSQVGELIKSRNPTRLYNTELLKES